MTDDARMAVSVDSPMLEDEFIIRRHLQGAEKKGSAWVGYVDSKEKLLELEHDLSMINVCFQTEHSVRHKGRLLFTAQRGRFNISLDVPFRVVSFTSKGCVFGRDIKNIRQKNVKKQIEMDVTASRKKRKLQGTKKKGCTAEMTIKEIEMYPEFKLEGTRAPKQKRTAAYQRNSVQVIARLKSALKEEVNGKIVLRQQRFYVMIADKESHSKHDFEVAYTDSAEAMSPEVSRKIEALVRQGVTSVKTMRSCLRFYVQNVLFAGKEKPPFSSRAYYPTKVNIGKHIQIALRKERFSPVNQEDVAAYIEELKKRSPSTNFAFRAYQAKSLEDASAVHVPNCSLLEAVAQECRETLVLCIQTKLMRKLALGYGRLAVCLDASFKVSSYSLPLFLITVQTPAAEAIVGVFVLQFETTRCIAEALCIFKSWNPRLKPKYWRVDGGQAAVDAVSETFPESRVVLCDSQREQMWHRWLMRWENQVTDINAVEEMLKQVACSANEDELSGALKTLTSSSAWRDNEKLRVYVTQKWLATKETWVKMYRQDLPLDEGVDTASRNRDLKSYLAGTANSHSLKDLLRILTENFFPDKELQLLSTGVSLSLDLNDEDYNDSDILALLPEESTAVTTHTPEHLASASDCNTFNWKKSDAQGTFIIGPTDGASDSHVVNLSVPSCTCSDFSRSKLPCKHIAAVFSVSDGLDVSHLPAGYREGLCATATISTSFGVDSDGSLGGASPNEDSCDRDIKLPLQRVREQESSQVLRLAIESRVGQLLSSLPHVGDEVVLGQILAAVTEASYLAEDAVARGDKELVGLSPTTGVSAVKRKRTD